MPYNTYIKDFNRFPSGAARTLAGATENISYKDPTTQYVALTSFVAVEDGTSLNELVKYRLKFENPTYAVNSPTTIKFLRDFFDSKTYNHQITTGKYIWGQFRGATAMFVSFVNGMRETRPARTKTSGWNNPFSSKFWACRVTRWFGSGSDSKRCYTYNYKKDGWFTVYVEGGYGDPSHLVVSLKYANGRLIETKRPDVNGQVTFTNLWGSFNDKYNPGAYIIETGDISTGYTHITRMWVPFQPVNNIFIHSRASAGVKQSLTGGVTHAPGINNAIWAQARGAAAPPSADIAAMVDEDDTLSNCATNRVNFYADIDEYFAGNLSWRFSYKLNGATSWTPIGTLQTIPVASLVSPVQVSAFANIPVTQLGGDFKLDITYPSGTITFNKLPTGEDATFELIEPYVDQEWKSIGQSFTPITGSINRNYKVTINYTASSCKAFTVELLRWSGDQSSSITDFMPLSSPLAGFTIVSTSTRSAGILHTVSVVDALNNKVPGAETYTYALRFKNNIAPFNIKYYPVYLRTPAEVDPDLGPIPATENFKVITLT